MISRAANRTSSERSSAASLRPSIRVLNFSRVRSDAGILSIGVLLRGGRSPNRTSLVRLIRRGCTPTLFPASLGLHHLDGETAEFVRLARALYSRSLGPWCTVEVMSVDWMRALADALAVHFPRLTHEPYFAECFSEMVEERHAGEALAVTHMVLRAKPALLSETLRDAKFM